MGRYCGKCESPIDKGSTCTCTRFKSNYVPRIKDTNPCDSIEAPCTKRSQFYSCDVCDKAKACRNCQSYAHGRNTGGVCVFNLNKVKFVNNLNPFCGADCDNFEILESVK